MHYKRSFGISVCKKCGFGFFKNVTLIKPLPNYEVLPCDIPLVLKGNEIDIDDELLPDPIYINERTNIIRQLFLRCNLMKINMESRYLAIFYLDQYFSSKRPSISPINYDLYSAVCVLLAAKIREVDTKTPFASEIKKFRDTKWNMRDLKRVEIQISEFFEWQLHYFTFFDYLEHFIFFGILFNTDCCNYANTKSSEVISTCASQNSFTNPEDRNLVHVKINEIMIMNKSEKKNMKQQCYDANDNTESNNDHTENNSVVDDNYDKDIVYTSAHKKERAISFSAKKSRSEMSPQKSEVLIANLEQGMQRNLASKLEERCQQIAKCISHDIPFQSFRQMHLALAIIKFVRNEFG